MRLAAKLLPLLFALCTHPAVSADAPSEPGDDQYRPQVGQSGKNVVWIPTPNSLVTLMLRAAKTTDRDLVYDLGAGDGKIPIAAARDFNAKAVGIEYNPELAALARRNAERAGVADKVTIIAGDIFETDFSKATVVTLYLLPDLNLKLRPLLLKMKPGTRIVSHQFDMREWEPDETMNVDFRDAFLWIVPAQVEGRWTFASDNGDWKAVADLIQSFQRVGGTLVNSGRAQPLLGPSLSGADMSFTFLDGDGAPRSIRGQVTDDRFEGKMRVANYDTRVTGRRIRAMPAK